MTDLPPHLADKLAEFKSALSVAQTALQTALETAQSQAGQDRDSHATEMRALETTCAHLRTEVSGLKKKLQTHIGAERKAEKRIAEAIEDIDAVLGKMNG